MFTTLTDGVAAKIFVLKWRVRFTLKSLTYRHRISQCKAH